VRVRLVALAVAGVSSIALAACGDSPSSDSPTTLGLTSTNWATVATVPQSEVSTVPRATPAPGETVPTEQTYTIQDGDTSRIKVATKCGVTVDALDAANTSTANYSMFFVGLEIIVPAGAIYQCGGTEATTTTAAGGTGTATATTTATGTGTTVAGSTTTTIAGGGDNCQAGSYTITAEDTTRVAVAQKFDVTVEQLDAANAATTGYSAFYPGLVIVIPPKAGC
jgi:LysM repeat protein